MPEEINNNLKTIIEIINNNFNTKKIILFGSFAYGEPTSESDIDLCIIMDLNNERKIQVMREIRNHLYEVVVMPIDFIIYTEEEFAERTSNPTTLEYKIEKEGKVLYAA